MVLLSMVLNFFMYLVFEPVHEKTNNFVVKPGPTQIRLYSHSIKLEAWNFGYKQRRNSTIRMAKTKVLIICAVTAQLICNFLFAYANCWFSHAKAHLLIQNH